jgi:hypothetical protein
MIYKLTSPQTEQCYVGSTSIPLNHRFSCHKSHYKGWLNKTRARMSSFEIVKYDDCSIELIELYNCENRTELRIREQYHIENTPNCVNKWSAHTTKEKTRQIKKKYLNAHRLEHSEYVKKYEQSDKGKAMHQAYYQRNRDKIIARAILYQQKKKNNIEAQME